MTEEDINEEESMFDAERFPFGTDVWFWNKKFEEDVIKEMLKNFKDGRFERHIESKD